MRMQMPHSPPGLDPGPRAPVPRGRSGMGTRSPEAVWGCRGPTVPGAPCGVRGAGRRALVPLGELGLRVCRPGAPPLPARSEFRFRRGQAVQSRPAVPIRRAVAPRAAASCRCPQNIPEGQR